MAEEALALRSAMAETTAQAAAGEAWKRFTPPEINTAVCMGRVWAGGVGGQCQRKCQDGAVFCIVHAKNDSWRTHGRVDGPIPEKKLQEFLKVSRKDSAATPSPKKPRMDLSATSPKQRRKMKAHGKDLPTTDLSMTDLTTAEAPKVKKPTGGAFGVFLAENRKSIQASLPLPADVKGRAMFGAVVKEASSRWKALPDEEKKPFLAKFDAKLAAYKSLPRTFKKNRMGLKRRFQTADGEKIKQPAGGGYGVWLVENRASVKASLPADHKMVDVVKKAGVLWRALPEEEKAAFRVKYDALRLIYKDAVRAVAPQALVADPKAAKTAKAVVADPKAAKTAKAVGAPVMQHAMKRVRRKKAW